MIFFYYLFNKVKIINKYIFTKIVAIKFIIFNKDLKFILILT